MLSPYQISPKWKTKILEILDPQIFFENSAEAKLSKLKPFAWSHWIRNCLFLVLMSTSASKRSQNGPTWANFPKRKLEIWPNSIWPPRSTPATRSAVAKWIPVPRHFLLSHRADRTIMWMGRACVLMMRKGDQLPPTIADDLKTKVARLCSLRLSSPPSN